MSGTTAPLGWFWPLSLNFFPYMIHENKAFKLIN
jgi:hypothetical protein